MKYDFSNTLFRASGNGNLMIGTQKVKDQTKPEFYTSFDAIGDTTKKYLTGIMINEVYSRSTELMNKYVQKGLMVEEDSITLFSRVRKQFFTKNSTHLQDEFTKGTPDIYIGESILRAETIIDIKSSFDIFTFFNSKREELNKNYYWQLQTYMSLTGATKAEVVYCLVNTPDSIIEGQKRKFIWDAGIKGEDEYNHEAFEMIEKIAKYDDIPMEERIFSFEFDRTDEDIERLHRRIILCRNWMNENFNSQK